MEQQFDVLQTLGRGSFGVVRKVRRKADGKTLVVKEMDYGAADEKQKEQIVAEVSSSIEQGERHTATSYMYVLRRLRSSIQKIMSNFSFVDIIGRGFSAGEPGRHRSLHLRRFAQPSRHEAQGTLLLSLCFPA